MDDEQMLKEFEKLLKGLENNYSPKDNSPPKITEKMKQETCDHEWVTTQLIYTTTKDCKKCLLKWEDYERIKRR